MTEKGASGNDMRAYSAIFTAMFVVSLLWLGLLLGVSFLATPVKFMAPSLSLSVALDVGRQTFTVFNMIEALLSVTLVSLALTSRHSRPMIVAVVMVVLVVLQRFWLLPVLDARVETILQGEQPPPSSLHEVYIAVDVVKLGLLSLAAVLTWRAHPRLERD